MQAGWMQDKTTNGNSGPSPHGERSPQELSRRLHEVEELVRQLTPHDSLTGLPTRRRFEEHLDLALARARRSDLSVAVVFVDLEGFGGVNERLGRPIGDEVLRQAADRLVEATRETDLVARQGGDEFLVLVADLERGVDGSDRALRSAQGVGDRVVQAFLRPFRVGGLEVPIPISLHISVFPEDGRDASALLSWADTARSADEPDRADAAAAADR
jgi:diguanylate cyclase (GGDEF)-like protein